MDIHLEPIERRIQWLFEFADRHRAEFLSSEAWLARERYRAEHPTAIVAPRPRTLKSRFRGRTS
jgi:hypothetical protein